MAEKRTKSQVTEQIRQAIAKSERSRYRLSLESGINQGQLSRFMAGQNLGVSGLEAIAEALGLEIVVRPARREKKGG